MSALEVLQWVNWADQDYLAARSLLIRGYILQGTILANTAIEKYIKAVLTLRNIPFPKGWRGHDVLSLYESFELSGAPVLNENFLRDLGKAYKLRYPDDLDEGFNISLASTKLLVELDCTAHAIRNGFNFNKQSGEAVVTRFDQLVAKHSTELMDRTLHSARRLDLRLSAIPQPASSCESYRAELLCLRITLPVRYRTTVGLI